MGQTWSQIFPPKAEYTEKNIPDLHGKVYMVTGATSGIGMTMAFRPVNRLEDTDCSVGYELATMLYQAGATVWMAGRSEEQCTRCIEHMKSAAKSIPNAGNLHFLYVALDDLNTIKPAVDKFLTAESRLDVLFNNAGVSLPPAGSKSAQGFELMMATNCLGPFLLAELLYPLLQRTAARTRAAAVRVVWTCSVHAEMHPPKDAMDPSQLDHPSTTDQSLNYAASKLGNWYLASEYAKSADTSQRTVLNVVQNPGGLKTNLLRHTSRLFRFCVSPLLYPPRQGAYTELFAGLSEEVTDERNGAYIVPWGRFHSSPPGELTKGLRTKDEGGTGQAAAFKEWCERNTRAFK